MQGFLVHEVDRIVNVNWKDVHAPPSGAAAGSSYLTAVTLIDDKMESVIDVERILAEVMGSKEDLSQEMIDKVGADKFIAKFDPDVLAEAVLEVLEVRE